MKTPSTDSENHNSDFYSNFNIMNNQPLNVQIRWCDEDKFFKILEQCIGFCIPVQIQMILKLNYYNNAFAMSLFDENSIGEMEDFIRNEFNSDMLANGESMSDALGIFTHTQKQFKILRNQRKLIALIAEYFTSSFTPQVPSQTTTDITTHLVARKASQNNSVVTPQRWSQSSSTQIIGTTITDGGSKNLPKKHSIDDSINVDVDVVVDEKLGDISKNSLGEANNSIETLSKTPQVEVEEKNSHYTEELCRTPYSLRQKRSSNIDKSNNKNTKKIKQN